MSSGSQSIKTEETVKFDQVKVVTLHARFRIIR
jgi:hypothetical protein